MPRWFYGLWLVLGSLTIGAMVLAGGTGAWPPEGFPVHRGWTAFLVALVFAMIISAVGRLQQKR
jgi:hypothetical protein